MTKQMEANMDAQNDLAKRICETKAECEVEIARMEAELKHLRRQYGDMLVAEIKAMNNV